jgi:hypothetical protein
MTDADLTALWALVQRDVGQRGVAGLFAATTADFAPACRALAATPGPISILTGFPIHTPSGILQETDGPLGAVFLARALTWLGYDVSLAVPPFAAAALLAAKAHLAAPPPLRHHPINHSAFWVTIECTGPARDGRHYSMRGRDITLPDGHLGQFYPLLAQQPAIGIGDGGNEVGMGKLPAEVIAACIPNGKRIACTIATTYLLAAGVSNWGAYALAAGVAAVRGQALPAVWFASAPHRELLRAMVLAGPLVDGVTGAGTLTVDNVPWPVYAGVLSDVGNWLAARGLLLDG